MRDKRSLYGSPYDKSISYTFPVGTDEWQLLQAPFRAHDNFAPGAAHLQLQFAAGPQKFEIAQLELRGFGALPLWECAIVQRLTGENLRSRDGEQLPAGCGEQAV